MICIGKEKGNDKARKYDFGYLLASRKLKVLSGNIKCVTRGSIIYEPYYMVFPETREGM